MTMETFRWFGSIWSHVLVNRDIQIVLNAPEMGHGISPGESVACEPQQIPIKATHPSTDLAMKSISTSSESTDGSPISALDFADKHTVSFLLDPFRHFGKPGEWHPLIPPESRALATWVCLKKKQIPKLCLMKFHGWSSCFPYSHRHQLEVYPHKMECLG